MGDTERVIVYLEPALHRALRVKAAETDTSVSHLVNDAVRAAFAEDAVDLAAFEDRAGEPVVPFENAVQDLKRRGVI